jgi:hypothetical protein
VKRYEPTNQWQGTPSDEHGWVSCGAYSNAVIVDAVSLGGCIPTGEQVRALTNEVEPNPADPGLTIPQLIAALARFGCRMEDRSKQRWPSVMADLRASRFLSISVWYASLRPYTAQASANFGHQVTIGILNVERTHVKMWDPTSRRKSGLWVPLTTVRDAMEDWGRESGLPSGQVRYARSRSVPLLAG